MLFRPTSKAAFAKESGVLVYEEDDFDDYVERNQRRHDNHAPLR